MAWVTAGVLIVAGGVGIVVRRNDSSAATSDSTVETSTAATSTTLAPALPVTIDLTSAVTELDPMLIVSYPIEPPGDVHPTAFATVAPGERIALLNNVTGVVRFIDGATRMDITQYPTEVPVIGSPSFVANDFFVGPDDVLYVDEGSADQALQIVAYARTGDKYLEVARAPHASSDGQLVLGASGVATIGQPDAPILAYVGKDGQPSGAKVEGDRLSLQLPSANQNIYTVGRGTRSWVVSYEFPPDAGLPESDSCVLCATAHLGPDDAVVLTNKSPTPDGDLQTKLTVLSDQVTTYDTDWDSIGVLGGKMLFDRLDQDSIDFGTAAA